MSLLSRFTSLFRPGRLNREIEDEQQFHIACRTDELIADGMEPAEAARQARLAFGSQTRAHEESHEAKVFAWLESIRQDVYYGLRRLAKAPSFAAIAILTLALGIGADTAIFSVVNGVLLNPLPYPHADRIISLFDEYPQFKTGSISYPNFLDWQRMNRSFSAMAAYRAAAYNLTGNGQPEHLQGEMISTGFFNILGVKPILGRTFNKKDDRLYAAPVAVISEALWRRKFGSSRNIIGQRLVANGIGRTIVGVIPSTFHLRIQFFERGVPLNDIYTPIGQFNQPHFYADRGSPWGMAAIGRLKPGVTFEQARQDMYRVSRELAAAYPGIDSNQKANLVPLKEEIVGNMGRVLLLLLGAASFVLLIACLNVASLLLARSTSRQREFAIRLAVGAGRVRVIRQLLTESILLALIGGGLGLMLAKFGTAAAVAAVPQTMPRAESIGLDLHVLLFTVFVSLVTGIIFGLTPAWKLRHANIGGALKESGRSIAGTGSRTQRVFVIVEMTMALVLLIGAGLMIRTLFALWNVDPGFHPRGVLTFGIAPQPSLATKSPAAIRAFYQQLHNRLASAPGVQAVSLSWGSTPMGGHENDSYFWFVGKPKPAHIDDLPMALRYRVEPGYLKIMQIPLKRGRFFNSRDDQNAPAVIVVDESLAKKYFPSQDPIGRYLAINLYPSAPQPNAKIIGVIAHVNQWGLSADAVRPLHAQIYSPIAQLPDQAMTYSAQGADVFVRGNGDRLPSFEALKKRLHSWDRELIAFDPVPMQQMVSRSIATQRFTMSLFAIFAGLALFLASIGIYGVLSYFVGQRRQEIGVRMALGAAPGTVLRMILKDGARMILTGIAAGVIASLGLVHLMSSLLFGVKLTDPVTFTAVVFLLCAIALLACYLPARRAMRIDPVVALREE